MKPRPDAEIRRFHRNIGGQNGHPSHMLGPLARYLFPIDSDDGSHPEVSAGIGGQAFPPIGKLVGGPQDDVIRLRERLVLAELDAIAVHAFYCIPPPFNETPTGGRKP